MRFFLLLFFLSTLINLKALEPLPGRLGSSEIYKAQFGEMKLFFYMTEEKDRISREYVKNLNEGMMLGIVQDPKYFPAAELIPLASLYRNPIDYDANGNAIYVDYKGGKLFYEYTQKLKSIAENVLNIKIKGNYYGANLVLNFDGNRFHQDEVDALYKVLENEPKPFVKHYIVQDLNLIDWQLADGTFSSMISQDPNSEDRFVFPLFPKEVIGIFCAEPALYGGPDKMADFTDVSALPPHSIVAPMDWNSSYTPGSAKGKRSSVVVRGVTTEEEIQKLDLASSPLPINRPKVKKLSQTECSYEYANGILFKDLPNKESIHVNTDSILSFALKGSLEVFETEPCDNRSAIAALKQLFCMDCPLEDVKVKHIIKRDSGFTSLLNALDIPSDSIVVCLNNSHLPEGYRHYNVGQDFTKEGLPWLQLYYFPPTRAVCMSADTFKALLLTPIEEIIFRDPYQDNDPEKIIALKEKISTELTIFIFPAKKI